MCFACCKLANFSSMMNARLLSITWGDIDGWNASKRIPKIQHLTWGVQMLIIIESWQPMKPDTIVEYYDITKRFCIKFIYFASINDQIGFWCDKFKLKVCLCHQQTNFATEFESLFAPIFVVNLWSQTSVESCNVDFCIQINFSEWIDDL